MAVPLTAFIRTPNPRSSNTDEVSQTDRAAVGPQPDNTPATGGATATGGGAVTKIIAGTGIAVSPGTGVGNVTVSATATGNALAYVTNIAGLRSMTAPSNNGDVVVSGGFYNEGDGGGGIWVWDSASTATDNTGLIVKITATATGRLYRQLAATRGNPTIGQTLDVRWFGAVPDFANDCAAPFALAYSTFSPGTKGACLHAPAGNYVFGTKCTISGSVDLTIKGDGRYATAFLYNIAGGADSIFAISVNVELLDFNITSLVGTQASVYLINLTGAINLMSRVYLKEYPCNYGVRHTGTLIADGVKIETSLGYNAFFGDGGRGVYRNCEVACADGLPVVIVRATGGSSLTSVQIQGGYYKGGGPWGAYAKVTMVMSANSGTMNEGQLSDFTLDTGGGGNPTGSKSLLMEASSSSYVMANWTLGDLWLNSGRCGLALKGVDDAGGSKTVRGIMGSNLITRPVSDYGVDIDQCRSVKLTGLATIAVGSGAIGVLIQNGGSNDSKDFQIQGCGSTVADFQCDYSVEFNGTKVKNARVDVSDLNNSGAYLLSGGANKSTQDLAVSWPDASGGMNFSGVVNINV